jgi:hypothetical protein
VEGVGADVSITQRGKATWAFPLPLWGGCGMWVAGIVMILASSRLQEKDPLRKWSWD